MDLKKQNSLGIKVCDEKCFKVQTALRAVSIVKIKDTDLILRCKPKSQSTSPNSKGGGEGGRSIFPKTSNIKDPFLMIFSTLTFKSLS